VGVSRARQVFDKMPDEVFNTYIVPLIKFHGWSATSKHSMVSDRWRRAFDNQRLKTIAELSWQRKELSFTETIFHPDSECRIGWLIAQHTRGANTPLANLADTKTRFIKCRQFIARTGRLPVPVILMRDYFSYRLLDGNHRIAALASLSPPPGFLFSVWVGSRSRK